MARQMAKGGEYESWPLQDRYGRTAGVEFV